MFVKFKIIITDTPPAMPGRLPEFDNSGKIRKPPVSEPLKDHFKEAFNEEQQEFKGPGKNKIELMR